MGWRRTLIAGLVFGALAGLYVADQRRLERRRQQRLAFGRLLPGPSDDVREILITRFAESIRLRREEARWRLIEPVSGEADPQTVADLLYYLEHQETQPSAPAGEDELLNLGLARPPLRLRLEGDGWSSDLTLLVGEDAPVPGEVYARLQGSDRWFTISRSLRDALRSPVLDFRDRSLLAFNPTEATRLVVSNQGTPLEMEKREDRWWILRPAPSEAEGEVVRNLLQGLHSTKATDFLDTETLELERYGLASPDLMVQASREDGDPPVRSTLLIGHRRLGEGGGYYALRLGRDLVFTAPQSLVDLARVSFNDVRSRRIFALTRERVQRLTLEVANSRTELIRDSSGRWRLTDEPAELDQEFIDRFLAQLLSVRVGRYLDLQPTAQQAGLQAPLLVVTLADREGAVEGLETGKSAEGADLVYARRRGQDEIFALPGDVPGQYFKTRVDFLDKSLFAFAPELVGLIRIAEGDRAIRCLKVGQGWTVSAEGGAESFQLNPNHVRTLIMSLLNLKWKERLDPRRERDLAIIKSRGLEAPDQTFAFLDAEERPLAWFGRGRVEPTDSLIYITLGEGRHYGLDVADYRRFLAALGSVFPRS